MAGWLEGLLGGGGSNPADLYGDLFTDKQKAALRDQQMTGLLGKLAGAFAAGGMPSRLPIPLGSTIGAAAAAGLGGEDEALTRMLTGMKTAEAVRESKQTREWQSKLNQMLMPIWQRQMAQGLPLNPPPPAVPVAPTDGPPAPNAPSPPAAAPAALPSQFGVPQQDLSRWGLPGAVTPYPQQRAGLLPPPDRMVGQALPGEGVLPKLAAMYGGGGESSAPFGEGGLPIRLAAATPGVGGDNAGREGRIAFWRSQGAPQHVAEGIADRVKAESGFNPSNMGDSGTSGGLYQHHADRLTRLRDFAAQQNRPWTDPGVQDQFAATEVQGGDAIAARGWPEILAAPDRATAAKLWDKYFERSKYGPGGQDTVIPSGRGVPASMLRNVADTGAPAPGASPTGTIPGLGMTPEALATLNALMKVNKLGSPFDSLLETYYKSPGYLAEKARTETQAQKDIALKMDPLIEEQNKRAAAKVDLEYKPKIEEAVQRLQNPILEERLKAKADIDRVTKEIEQNRNAAFTQTDATIAGPDGQPIDTRVTALDFALKQKDRAARIAKGDLAIRPGDIIGKPSLSPEQTAAQTERGKAPYTSGDITLTWPDGETRKVTVTGEQRKDVLEGRPVPAIGWPGTTGGTAPDGTSAAAGGGRVGEVVYPPGYAEATTIMLKERRPKAEAAVKSLNFNETAQRLLDAGIISGYGAGFRLDAAKAKALLGWDDQRIANTETFLATQARQVAAILGSGDFGSGASITDEDRRQAARMAGADSALDEKSLRFLVRLNGTAANWEIDRYKADVKRHDPKGRLPILQIDVPPKAETQPSANQPAPVGRSQLGGKPYIKWSDGKWREEGELPGEEKR